MYKILNITNLQLETNRYYNKDISFYDRSKINSLVTLKPGESYIINNDNINLNIKRLEKLKYIKVIEIVENKIINEENKLIKPLNIHSTDLNKVTIIIPTYKNVKYINECIDSIKNNISSKLDIELIIGIDNCTETKDYILKNRDNYNNIKFVYFNVNVGPYIVKNTLIQYASNNSIIFFDSDDLFLPNSIIKIVETLKTYDYVMFRYNEFSYDKKMSNVINFGEGVIGISKEKFLKLNGYQPWKCAADTEFRERYSIRYKDKIKMNEVLFNRRIHLNSLTKRNDTGYNSNIRKEYIIKISENKKRDYPNPEILHIENNHYIL